MSYKQTKKHCRGVGLICVSSSQGCMASVLKVILTFLHKLCPSGNNIKRFARRLVLFIAFLGSRLSIWLRSWHGKTGTTRRKSTLAEPPSPCATASYRTVSPSSPDSRQNLVVCSTVPTSTSVPGLQNFYRGTSQLATAIPSEGAILPPGVDTLTADHIPCLTSSSDGRTPASLSSTNLSIHSSTSHGHNIITHSLESLHTPVNQPSGLAGAAHREPGQGQDISQSIERQSRSSPTDGLCRYTHLDIDTSNISFDHACRQQNYSFNQLCSSAIFDEYGCRRP